MIPGAHRARRYLTGIDWIMHSLDDISRHAGGRGTSSQVVLSIDGVISPERLRRSLETIKRELPVLGGRVGRDWNLCPCWKYGPETEVSIALSVVEVEDGELERVQRILERHANRDFAEDGQNLQFLLLITGADHCYLAMHFDHRILDAKGAEAFLELLRLVDRGEHRDAVARVELTEPPHLDRWGRRFRGGRMVNRLQRALGRRSVAALPVSRTVRRRDTRQHILPFSPEQTRRVKDRISGAYGPMLVLPRLLYSVLAPVGRLLRQRDGNAEQYIVPVTVDRRENGKIWEKLLFNHLSFLFLPIPEEAARKPHMCRKVVREELFDQISGGVPDAFYHAAMLTRIAPLPVMRALSRIPLGGVVGTMYFACLKKASFGKTQYFGGTIDNLFHTPNVPVPPGLGVCANFFGDRFNLVLSHVDGLLTERETDELLTGMRERLLDEHS